MTIPAGTLVPRDARDFGSYQLLAKLATGGMAEIYLARPSSGPGEKDLMVLKRILPHLAEDEHFVTMFRDEADLAAKLAHKNVCNVRSFGQFAGTWFIAMEYLHGVPLSRMMTKLSKAGKMLDYRVVAGIICQACEGLHAAHEARGPDGQLLGVVHRDVSPPNIMVTGDGTVKLLDFGIAKARGANSRTRTGTVKGKNAYMSPEQILGKPLDRRSDIFALGVVMYEMLSIRRLFHRDSDFLTFKAITEEPIPEIRDRRPDLPPGMRAALLQAMARDPAGRFDTAQAFGNAIRNSVATLGGPAQPQDLARLLFTDFGDEMAARDEILKAADDPNAAPISLGPAKSPATPVPRPPPIPRSASGEMLPAGIPQRNTPTGEAVPSVMVTPGSSKIQMPDFAN
ncbi:MAG TPA: serine/threonine-protein kinase, partial [Kofleriaceae bacterium]|nr:serine/threonine-protein kinase [Kofleriaceae bacterium]